MSPARLALTPGTIADELHRRLIGLDYPAFARCVCRLLEALGYEDVRLAGRHEWKGYNRPGGGGYDLEALLPGGVAPRRVVAQIKQFDGLHVHQRNVDELRGACLRAGAAEALLVTTSVFSDVVSRSAAARDPAGTPVAPVRLIDGQDLLGLLIRHRLGVREAARAETMRVYQRGQGTMHRLEIDQAFFDKTLHEGICDSEKEPAPRRRAALPASKPGSKARTKGRGWRLTVSISPDSPSPDARRSTRRSRSWEDGDEDGESAGRKRGRRKRNAERGSYQKNYQMEGCETEGNADTKGGR